ncbi:hypothetical protein HUK65_15285 [Rhodobacteraceae bacterium 2376]|uniref:Lipoprotein n=1 Tax=Rhabdonatronobacter sediminivivens TaxID=2743469 RepID=A0A7Z0I1S4_9RHOB|nr:hypothetical protein [Rhabdonatronobacter sediminivivens]NYS26351.1 hypothetical protein [Rhabdonatronobacter sediminivivens]
MPKTPFRLPRRAALLGAILLLGACASGAHLGEQRGELGDFRLGHAIVVAESATMGPASRRADPEDWENTLQAEIERRFARYEGDSYYHIAVAVQGYVLAMPGIPLVASPRSVLIAGVTIWDDEAGTKLNETPHRITVLESLSGETVVSSGLTQSAEQQMQNLSQNAVGAIERWMASNPDWFRPSPAEDADTPTDAAPEDISLEDAALEDMTDPAEG